MGTTLKFAFIFSGKYVYEPKNQTFVWFIFLFLPYFPLCKLVFIYSFLLFKYFFLKAVINRLIGLFVQLIGRDLFTHTWFASFKQKKKKKKKLKLKPESQRTFSNQVFQMKRRRKQANPFPPIFSSSKKQSLPLARVCLSVAVTAKRNMASCISPALNLTVNAGTGWLADSHWRRSYTHLPYETAWRPTRRLEEGWP